MLDPESQYLLQEVLPQYTPKPGMSADEKRALAFGLGKRLQGEPPWLPRVVERRIPTQGGSVLVRLYYPVESSHNGWMLWIHGGGFMTGGLDTHDTLCRRLALTSGQVVVSIDYRLAPENRYPAALTDCYAALCWLRKHAEELDLDSEMASVGGSSAGGNLAAALTLLNRDQGGAPLRHQLLVYPFVDATMSFESYTSHAVGYQLTTEMMRHYLENYLGSYDTLTDPYLSPLWALDHSGLPPAHVVIAELDPLAGESAAYAARLASAGVSVEISHYSGVMHGFFAQAGVLEKARIAQERSCALLRSALG
jgi:acetyl esterase